MGVAKLLITNWDDPHRRGNGFQCSTQSLKTAQKGGLSGTNYIYDPLKSIQKKRVNHHPFYTPLPIPKNVHPNLIFLGLSKMGGWKGRFPPIFRTPFQLQRKGFGAEFPPKRPQWNPIFSQWKKKNSNKKALIIVPLDRFISYEDIYIYIIMFCIFYLL